MSSRIDGICVASDGGTVDGGTDAGSADSGIMDAAADAGADTGSPGGCAIDDFDGSGLGPQWRVAEGGAPTYTVSGSRLRITDAPLVTTPSMPGTSWIYDPSMDLGNQLAWNYSVGTGDFTLEFDISWDETTLEQGGLAGVGLTDAANRLHVMGGIYDGSYRVVAARHGLVGDQKYFGTRTLSGSATFTIARTSGTVTVTLDGAPVLTHADASALEHLVIVYVQLQGTDLIARDFPTVELGQIQLCR